MKITSVAKLAVAASIGLASLAFCQEIEGDGSENGAVTPTDSDGSLSQDEQEVVEETEEDLLNGVGVFDSEENLAAWTAVNPDYYLNEM